MFKHTRMFMAVKTITITKDAYEKLASNKKEGESFSELINRNFTRKGNVGDIMKFAGAWSDMSDEEADELKKNIEKLNKGAWKSIARKVKGI